VLDRLDGDVVGDGFAGEALVAEVSGVDDFEGELLAGLGAAEAFGEGGERVLAADFE
jgi:hypothetical protein